jgi:hypothetical protein
MTLAERKACELEQKIASFGTALDRWLDDHKAKGFLIHTSQMNAIQAIFSGLQGGLKDLFEEARADGAILGRAMSIEQTILSAYQVWEFYRGKFAQREDPNYQPYLRIADEFAWACYILARPPREIEQGLVKEPPLVYLNSGWSPFVKSRDREYQVESVPRALLEREPNFNRAVSQLPFPLIGIPWYQIGFLPAGVAIAHEVGHVIELECCLTKPLHEAIRAAVHPDRADDWLGWASEIFADLYGCLCVGPAFVRSLAETLTAAASRVDAASDPAYPSPWLRVLLNCRMLFLLHHTAQATALAADWLHAYPSTGTWTAYEVDLDPLVTALLAIRIVFKPGVGGPLSKLAYFSPEQENAANECSQAILKQNRSTPQNLRVLFAAASIAYLAEPVDFFRALEKGPGKWKSPADRFRGEMSTLCRDDKRSGELARPPDRREALRTWGASLLLLKTGI